MRYLTVTYRQKKNFLKDYLEDVGASGGVFYMSRDEFLVGEEVVVRFIMRDVALELFVRGEVVWRRSEHKATPDLPPGIGVAFLDSERDKNDYLQSLARGKQAPRYSRRRSRVPVKMRVLLRDRPDTELREVTLIDLSEDGAFLQHDRFVPENTPIELRISHESLLFPLKVRGIVVRQGIENGVRGVGVRFQATPRRQRKIARILEALQLSTVGR